MQTTKGFLWGAEAGGRSLGQWGAGLQSTFSGLGGWHVGADLCSGSFLAVTLPEDTCGCHDWGLPASSGWGWGCCSTPPSAQGVTWPWCPSAVRRGDPDS